MESVRAFCSNRPPMAIFLLCLASFGLTTFSLSVYVAQSDKIRNPDVLDWNSLLSKLTKLDYCLPSSPSVYNVTSQTNASFYASMPVQVSEEFAEAFYKLKTDQSFKTKGWIGVKFLGQGLPVEFQHDFISVAFEFPPKSGANDDNEVCLEIGGPKGLLQYLEFNETTCGNRLKSTTNDVPLMIHSPDHKPLSWCLQNPKDIKLNLELEMDLSNPNFMIYVSAKDKELIHLHLMVTSVFLFAILASVIIAFIVKSVNHNRKTIDARGDHHIIGMPQSSDN